MQKSAKLELAHNIIQVLDEREECWDDDRRCYSESVSEIAMRLKIDPDLHTVLTILYHWPDETREWATDILAKSTEI